VKLRTITALYIKARINSWLITDRADVSLFLTNMERISVATFINGRYASARTEFPDTVPPGWTTPETPTDDLPE
jgi:hypothetical protein